MTTSVIESSVEEDDDADEDNATEEVIALSPSFSCASCFFRSSARFNRLSISIMRNRVTAANTLFVIYLNRHLCAVYDRT